MINAPHLTQFVEIWENPMDIIQLYNSIPVVHGVIGKALTTDNNNTTAIIPLDTTTATATTATQLTYLRSYQHRILQFNAEPISQQFEQDLIQYRADLKANRQHQRIQFAIANTIPPYLLDPTLLTRGGGGDNDNIQSVNSRSESESHSGYRPY